jgi:arylsulfatase B
MQRYGFFILACLCCQAAAASGNVLLIIADDIGIDSLSGFNDEAGASFAPTPTLDQLQLNGVSFDRFYAYPTCSPTRAALMTGRHAFRTGVTAPEDNRLQSNDFTLPENLTAAGVIGDRMACIGKWHLGGDNDAPNTIGGWPHYSGALGGGLNSYTQWTKVVNGSSSVTTNYATSDGVDDALAWIAGQESEPWFLWLAFNAPHTPLHRPPEELHDYNGLSETAESDSREHYEAMVQAMDTEIGRLLAAIDLTQTTVIFMGDNGTPRGVLQPPYSGNHSKGSIYEGGVRVPMIVAGEQVHPDLAGTRSNTLVHVCDLFGTILGLFGVAENEVVPAALTLDSHSFFPLLRDGVFTNERDVVYAFKASNDTPGTGDYAMIGNTFKYVLFEDGSEALFKVDTNLRERVNFLEGTLNTDQSTAYSTLSAQLGEFRNVPLIDGVAFAAESALQIDVGWYADASLTLWRSEDLTNWSTVTGAQISDTGGATFTVSDPAIPEGPAFYFVSQD